MIRRNIVTGGEDDGWWVRETDHLTKVEKERLRERQALVCEIDSRVEEITKLRELIVGAIEAIEVLRLLGKLTGHETSITDAWLFSAKAAMKEKDEEIAQWKRVVVTHTVFSYVI